MNSTNSEWSEYQKVRIPWSGDRSRAWKHIARHLQRYIQADLAVLELACGYGDFSNNVGAVVRVAMDANPEFGRHLDGGVRFEAGDSTDLSRFESNSFGTVFASNFLEHLERPACVQVAKEVFRVLRPGGTFLLLQPNFALRPREYFDDYTHVSIFTDKSLPDFLVAQGFGLIKVQRRFLPLTFKSRASSLSFLVPWYLRSPLKPLAGQMLVVVARP